MESGKFFQAAVDFVVDLKGSWSKMSRDVSIAFGDTGGLDLRWENEQVAGSRMLDKPNSLVNCSHLASHDISWNTWNTLALTT